MKATNKTKTAAPIKTITVIPFIVILMTGAACEDFVKIDPPKTEITSETVFTSDAAATAAIRGIYSLMMTDQSFTKGEMERFTGLSSDEFTNYSNSNAQQQFSLPSLLSTNSNVYGVFWSEAYKYINNANAILEGLQKSSAISSATKNQLEGEARFIRAFCHFYLANLFGDVPYITTTDYGINSIASRIDKADVNQKVIEELLIAQDLMADDFSFSGNERIQPNKGAATALLSRAYLYARDWANAEAHASDLISNANYSLGTDLNKIFLANSTEAIWQLKPVIPGLNTPQGQLFILIDVPTNVPGNVALSTSIANSFETGDARKDNWIGVFTNATDTYYYPLKYKISQSVTVTEYSMVFRLAEQFLIRAEARSQLNNIVGAQSDINIIRHRAGLGDTPANDQPSLLLAIEQERKVELFTEWDHRWLDLKRTNRADVVLGPIKVDWQTTDTLYPIPQSETVIDPNLIQNPGY